MTKTRVFISSTYHDLIPFRKKIWEDLSEMNIHILGMEKFGARSSTPLNTCLQEVTKSDVFIGIIAYKYGSIDKKSKKSFTQLEYERARELKKEILIYLFDDEGLIQPKYIDFGTKGNKLNRFKNLLKKNHTIDFFKDPNDLSSKIVNQLQTLKPLLPRKIVRPKILESRIFRFNIADSEWIAFIGYLDNSPFEIYTGMIDPEMFPIPDSINTGRIILNYDDNGNERFDFQFVDKYGYKNTLGGLKHVFNKQMSIYNAIITKLLMQNTPIHIVVEAIQEMTIHDIENSDDWKKGIITAVTS